MEGSTTNGLMEKLVLQDYIVHHLHHLKFYKTLTPTNQNTVYKKGF
jgi:hypothetical protein